MAETPKDSDQSMEDILQSIKRIIADEGDAPPTEVTGSDVLELTDLLAEDVAVPMAPTPEPEPILPEPQPEIGTLSIDEIMAAPISAMPQMASPLAPAAAPEPEPEPEPQPVFEPAPAHEPAPPAADEDAEKLMSDATLAASVAALHALSHKPQSFASHDSPIFRSGTTVEDLVLESLKPMLKDWLDGNLPSLVRQLVEREIRRLSGM